MQCWCSWSKRARVGGKAERVGGVRASADCAVEEREIRQ